jgi:hypothetical protein
MHRAPFARRRIIGQALRQARQDIGLDLDVVAGYLGCDPSRVSRIEDGQRGIQPDELRDLMTQYGIDQQAQDVLVMLASQGTGGGWWTAHGGVLPASHLDWAVTEAVAAHVQVYAPVIVPELLRTEAYARAVLSADPAVPEHDEEALVQATLARQQAVLHEQKLPMTVVLGEAALRNQVGGEAVHSHQLARLGELASTDYHHVCVRLLPFDAGVYPAGESGGFSLIRFMERPALGLVHVAGTRGSTCLNEAAVITAYGTVFDQLQTFALTPSQSRQRLVRRFTRP